MLLWAWLGGGAAGRGRLCRTKAGQVYREGEGYTADCVTYTCTKAHNSNIRLFYFDLKPSRMLKC